MEPFWWGGADWSAGPQQNQPWEAQSLEEMTCLRLQEQRTADAYREADRAEPHRLPRFREPPPPPLPPPIPPPLPLAEPEGEVPLEEVPVPGEEREEVRRRRGGERGRRGTVCSALWLIVYWSFC